MGTVNYKGRFAPSPTGPLHLGSLVSALGSWTDARHHKGLWTVRVEDIDPQRESPQATEQILSSLQAHHLYFDEEVTYQHQHSQRYDEALDVLRHKNRLYACTCTRKNLRALERSDYPGICRQSNHAEENRALRVQVENEVTCFNDQVYGQICENVAEVTGDFIVRRRGPLYAYQLAVVADDAAQQITHVVRGADLLDNTPRQISLQQMLSYPTPEYLHLPLALAPDGRKLSKQTGAKALDDAQPLQNLKDAWKLLGQPDAPPSSDCCVSFLKHCTKNWDRKLIPSPSI